MKSGSGAALALGVCTLFSCALTSKNNLKDQDKQTNVVSVSKISLPIRDAKQKAFIAANEAPLWKGAKVYANEFSADITSAATTQERPAASADDTPKKIEAIAAAFIQKNSPFFGIDGISVAKKCKAEVNKRVNGRVNVKCEPIAYPGTEKLSNNTYEPKFVVMVKGGKAIHFVNRSQRLPDFSKLNVEASIKKDDKKLWDKMLGKEMKYANIAGKEISAGTVKKEHLSEPVLGIFSHRPRPDVLKIHLAWLVNCKIGELTWQFAIDAHTGEIIRLKQNFFT